MTIGRFFAVGVGPGDPALITVKAVEVIRRAHVVYHAGPADDRGRALEVVRTYLKSEQSVRAIRSESMAELSSSNCYRRCVDEIAAECRQSRDVAFITEGDPTLYSTAANIWPLLAESYPDLSIEVIPGVTSIAAAAARMGWPLARRDETVAIVPAGYHADELPDLLERFNSLCLLKPSRVLPTVAESLRERGNEWQTAYLENVSRGQEWITSDLASAAERTEYFSLALIRRSSPKPQPESSVRGRVAVVGLGPGDPDLLGHRALRLIRGADAIVGYEGYLRLLEPLRLSAELYGSPIGGESQRARQALELARAGRRVALVSSGDAGVYGMASLLLEAAEPMPDVEIEVVPGVTAATAAAALLGAPLGHDFACISLSDLLTPWDIIERRLEAAGQGDFAVALYNPVSSRRTWQLPQARDILLKYRKAETPVGLVDKAYRSGCRVWHTTLGALTTEGVTMETTIIVGNSQTRIINGRMLTPRGYALPARSASEGEPTPLLALRAADSILKQSFAIIERELGPDNLPPWAFAVARRMIHASADFEFAQTMRYSADFDAAIRIAFADRRPIVTDTEMVRIGIRAALAEHPEVTLACHLNDPAAFELAETAGLTRTAAGIRLAARRYANPILVIGNAPTALDEALRLVEQDGWRPAAIIGMPVGFVGVEEAKSRLLRQSAVPYLTCTGRKGGSAVAAAAVNALIELFGPNSNA